MLNSLVKVAAVVQLEAPNAARYTQIQSVLDASVRACYPESFVLCTKFDYFFPLLQIWPPPKKKSMDKFLKRSWKTIRCYLYLVVYIFIYFAKQVTNETFLLCLQMLVLN